MKRFINLDIGKVSGAIMIFNGIAQGLGIIFGNRISAKEEEELANRIANKVLEGLRDK